MSKYSDREIEEMYDQMLDDCYEDIEICGYKYSASIALFRVDAIAYGCGLSDYTSTLQEEEEEEEEVKK